MTDRPSLSRSFPVPVATSAMVPLLQLLLDELGCPSSGEPVVERSEGDAERMDSVTTTWTRGAVRLSLHAMTDHDHPPMESADRRAWVSVGGLPGGMSVIANGEGNASRFEAFTLYGAEAGRAHVLEALGAAFDELVGSRATIWPRLHVPKEWQEHSLAVTFASFIVGRDSTPIASWASEIGADGVRYATEVGGGGLAGASTHVWRSPVGPIPKSNETSYFSLSRAGRAGAAPPEPSLPSLAKTLLEATLERPESAAPLHVHQPHACEMRRFRTGPWVLLDAIEPTASDPDKKRLRLRFQHESGDPWCLLLDGEYRTSGWAQLGAKLIGDAAARSPTEARLETWATENGFELTRRY